MFESLFVLAGYGFFQGGGVGDLLNYAEQAGFFSFVLPFLLIFAIVFATINNMKLFGQQKAVSAVIALCVGLLALQFNVVPIFFSEIFPRVGIALSVMLAVLIILGLFIPTAEPAQKFFHYLLLGMAFIALFVVLFQQAFSSFWYDIFYFFDAQTFTYAMVILTIFIAVAAIIGVKPKNPRFPPLNPALFYPRQEDARG